jgi:hypothetical protein
MDIRRCDMRAIPMKGKVGKKRIQGYMWAGEGKTWAKKENYFQLESNSLVSAAIVSPMGEFWIRCKGGTCKVMHYSPGRKLLGTTLLALPGGKKK